MSTVNDKVPEKANMMHTTNMSAAQEALTARWLVGKDTPLSPAVLPPEWRALLPNPLAPHTVTRVADDAENETDDDPKDDADDAPAIAALDALPLASQQETLAFGLATQHALTQTWPVPPAGVLNKGLDTDAATLSVPALALPLLPAPLRLLCRAALNALAVPHSRVALLHLLAARGVVCHPLDLAGAERHKELLNELADPDVAGARLATLYAPWQAPDPANTATADTPATSSVTLLADPERPIDAANWDDFTPHARALALTTLRTHDPAVARELMTARVASLPAEARAKAVDTLAVSLGIDDLPLLHTLETDRSSKVQAVVMRLLGRLGVAPQSTELAEQMATQATELAATLTVNHGVTATLKKAIGLGNDSAPRIAPVKLKTTAQQPARPRLLMAVPLPALAGALGLSVDALVTGWAFDAHSDPDNMAFVSGCAETLPDASVPTLANALLTVSGKDVERDTLLRCWQMLWPRLSKSEQDRVALALWQRSKPDWVLSEWIGLLKRPLPDAVGGQDACAAIWRGLTERGEWKAVIGRLDAQQPDNTTTATLLHLGVLLPHSVALQALDALRAHGLLPLHPDAVTLRLNIELPPHGR